LLRDSKGLVAARFIHKTYQTPFTFRLLQPTNVQTVKA